MKVLAILLCAFIAVQGRSAGSNTKALAVLGEHPYIVHLRIAVSTSGLLNTCAGSLISESWVLTTASCVQYARFIWIRYGVVDVVNPSLVTEASTAVSHSDANLGIINTIRFIQSSDFIASVPVAVGDSAVPDLTNFCAFGSNDADGPGERLTCFDVALEKKSDDEYTATSDDGAATEFDLGAPLMSDEGQIGILVGAGSEDDAGTFLAIAGYVDWIAEQTGLRSSKGVKSSES